MLRAPPRPAAAPRHARPRPAGGGLQGAGAVHPDQGGPFCWLLLFDRAVLCRAVPANCCGIGRAVPMHSYAGTCSHPPHTCSHLPHTCSLAPAARGLQVGDSKPGFFAIASGPDEARNNAGSVELLIKDQPGSTAEMLCKAKAGGYPLHIQGRPGPGPAISGSWCCWAVSWAGAAALPQLRLRRAPSCRQGRPRCCAAPPHWAPLRRSNPSPHSLPLLSLSPSGDEVLVSAPMGKGFPVDRVPPASHPTLLLFATGSGISPIKVRCALTDKFTTA